jgi:hypothetical protein
MVEEWLIALGVGILIGALATLGVLVAIGRV